jgi:hypothetical protein
MNFSLVVSEARVDNAHPSVGESQRYEVSDQGHGHMVEPAIIAVLP